MSVTKGRHTLDGRAAVATSPPGLQHITLLIWCGHAIASSILAAAEDFSSNILIVEGGLASRSILLQDHTPCNWGWNAMKIRARFRKALQIWSYPIMRWSMCLIQSQRCANCVRS